MVYEVGQHVIIIQGHSLPHISWVSEYMDKYVGIEAVITYAETSPFDSELEIYELNKLNGDKIGCWWAGEWLMPVNYDDSLKALNDFMSDFGR